MQSYSKEILISKTLITFTISFSLWNSGTRPGSFIYSLKFDGIPETEIDFGFKLILDENKHLDDSWGELTKNGKIIGSGNAQKHVTQFVDVNGIISHYGLSLSKNKLHEVDNPAFNNALLEDIKYYYNSLSHKDIVYEKNVQDGSRQFDKNNIKILNYERMDKIKTVDFIENLSPTPSLLDSIINNIFTPVSDLLPASNQKELKVLFEKENGSGSNFENSSFGNYYYEIFFHIPYLLANHLNSVGKYKEANFWYNKIFDTTSFEDNKGQLAMPSDRYWRFIGFREMTLASLSSLYGNTAGSEINTYNKDPFNPHTIARLRSVAYPKNIVMKYLDNLLDWADSLYALYLPETVNESFMLYTMVSDILGVRPESKGKCKTHDKLTYEKLVSTHDDPSLNQSEFLIYAMADQQPDSPKIIGMTKPLDLGFTITESRPIYEVVKELAFCFPSNEQFLKYWDRLESRLFNIHNCLDINGIKRNMPLFALWIDPAMLVRARSAGLSLEDILAQLNNQIAPYRFSYLIEKAKQFCGTVQNYGGALLHILEKKDVEELNILRSTHEQNILKMTVVLKKQHIEDAKKYLESLSQTKNNIEYRVQYYKTLIEKGLIKSEIKQQQLRKESGEQDTYATMFKVLSSQLRLIPNLGAPTAITYGGDQLGHSSDMFSTTFSHTANKFQRSSDASGLEASNQRREEEWKFQLKIAEQELKAFEIQLEVAKIRIAIAEKDLEIHQKNIEQSQELYNFYKEKFSNIGLYTYHANTLQRLYRMAYNMAYDLARMAERAYQFERGENEYIILNDNWNGEMAGLLAGEKLLLQLQQLEKKWIENNKRTPEITQSFSMQQIAPDKLLQLKKDGECVGFEIPEAAFDLVYPGYFKRIIKSVRITMPCIVGPYTNVGATLSLTGSKVRKQATAGDLSDLTYSGMPNIATSNAQNDGGQFELNFRDERFLPFEGAGAVSTWTLGMPTKIRPFDYNTIADVIFHISYTAQYDGGWKGTVESALVAQLNAMSTDGLLKVFSLRYDFPQEYNKLKNGSASEKITIGKEMLPYFAQAGFDTIGAIIAVYKDDGGGLVSGVPTDISDPAAQSIVTFSNKKIANLDKIKDIIWVHKYSIKIVI